jgi:hypothetical protein
MQYTLLRVPLCDSRYCQCMQAALDYLELFVVAGGLSQV